MLGLAGGHRVGKTTLAKLFAEKQKFTFAQTSVSQVFKDLGHDPAEKFDFQTRLTIQEQILLRLNRFYAEQDPYGQVITDRTPIDMMAYTLAEAVGEAVNQEDQERLKRYINDCYTVANRWFSQIVIVQPGIPIVDAEGKAVANEAYIEHLNSLIKGLCCDERLKVPHYLIPRTRLDLDDRIESLTNANRKTHARLVEQIAEVGSRVVH